MLSETFRSALFISSSFDASIEQTLLPFMGGGAAVIFSDEVREQPLEFWRQVERDRVSFISCVPSYLESILQQVPDTVALQHLALGGEALTLQFRNRVARELDVAQITNLYGPTEATIDAISHRVGGEEAGYKVPIGHPMANYQAYVLDDNLEPVAPGVAGDLYIAGPGWRAAISTARR